MNHGPSVAIGAALCAAAGLSTTSAAALPAAGDPRPHVKLVDAWDRTVEVASIATKPMLVVYEDKDAGAQNKELKEELRRLGASERYRSSVAVLLIADLEAYDYWPVRGFAKNAVKEKSSEFHIPIYCDWNGAVRSAFDLRRGTSNVVLYGRDGRVVFAHAGNMSADTRREAMNLLQEQARVAAAF